MGFEIKINRDELAKKKVMLATPMYGGQCAGMYTRSIADMAVLFHHWGVQLQLYFLFNESLITRARNYCADEFMRSDCTHLMFIDSDIGFDPKDVMAMLAMATDESDYDVLCGPYPKKCISWEKIKSAVDQGKADASAGGPQNLDKYVGDFVFNPLPGVGSIQLDRPSEVLESGTGFMMIRRAAFEKLKVARPDLLYRPDHVRTEAFDGTREIMAYFMDPIDKWNREKLFRETLERIAEGNEDAANLAADALSHQEPESRRLLSEDYFFCQEIRKAGGHVWLCPWMHLTHVGSMVFGGSLQDIAAIGQSATADVNLLRKRK